MRLSRWDLIAPAYWTREQNRALASSRTARLKRSRSRRSDHTALLTAREHRRRQNHLALSFLLVAALGIWLFNFADTPAETWAEEVARLALLMIAATIALRWLLRAPRIPAECHLARRLRVSGFLLQRSAPDASLAEELQLRANAWAARLQNRPGNTEFGNRLFAFDRTTALVYAAGLVLVLAGILLFEARGAAGTPVPGSGCLIQVGIFVPLITHFYFVLRIRRRLRGALDQVNCPDCGYDLRGSVAAIPARPLDRLTIGPERCPECGSLWPLLPPPECPTACRFRPSADEASTAV